jgi:predicted RND superfamily exporter protein
MTEQRQDKEIDALRDKAHKLSTFMSSLEAQLGALAFRMTTAEFWIKLAIVSLIGLLFAVITALLTLVVYSETI